MCPEIFQAPANLNPTMAFVYRLVKIMFNAPVVKLFGVVKESMNILK